MANTLITPQIVAREAVIALENLLVAAQLMDRRYDKEYRQIGDTLTLRKHTTFTSSKFNAVSGVTAQNITEDSFNVQLTEHDDVTFGLGSKELALDIVEYREQTIEPAMRAIAQGIDSWILSNMVTGIPYHAGTAGTAPSGIADIAAVNRVLTTNKEPRDGRNYVILDEYAEEGFAANPNFTRASEFGSTDGLRNAALGKIHRRETYISQNVAYHTTGTLASEAGVIQVSGTVAAAATGILLESSSGTLTGTLLPGDLLSIGTGRSEQQFVVNASGTASSNMITASVYPAVGTALANHDAVTLRASHAKNPAFHKEAFALVTAPLMKPKSVQSEVINYKGFAVRVVYWYDGTYKKEYCSLDVLYGGLLVTPELAAVLMG